MELARYKEEDVRNHREIAQLKSIKASLEIGLTDFKSRVERLESRVTDR